MSGRHGRFWKGGMGQSNDPKVILRRVGAGPDDGIDLAEAALALAAVDLPQTPLDPYRGHLAELADALTEASGGGADLPQRCAALTQTIHSCFGYEGDTQTYDDLENANLIQVIDRRKGLPIALGILYLHAARRNGWDIVGLSFPGHFLLRLDCAGERAILDPFHRGRICGASDMRDLLKTMQGAEAELTAEHYRPVSDREVLLRLQNNVKLRLIQMEQPAKAAAIVEIMMLFAPGRHGLWREAGLMHAHAGNLGHAIAAFESFLKRETGTAARHEVATDLQHLRRRLN
jgi:regulator of sirC expression with transglutaminase-like and TPR domain